MSSALLGALGVEMLQNVAGAKAWAVFLQKCRVTNVLEGYPSSSLATGLPEAILFLKHLVFEGF